MILNSFKSLSTVDAKGVYTSCPLSKTINFGANIKIDGVETALLNKINYEIDKQKDAGNPNITSIYKKSDEKILKKILRNVDLPQENQGIIINTDQQRLLGLYFKSIPEVSNDSTYLVKLNSGYIFVSAGMSKGKSFISPIPLQAKDDYGKDPRMLGEKYRYSNLTENEKIAQLDAFTKSGRAKIGKVIDTVPAESVALKMPHVEGRPLKVAFLSLYPQSNGYIFQSIGPNYIESYLKDNMPEGSVDVTYLETALNTPAEIKEKLNEIQPDIIGVSTKTNSHKQLDYWMPYLQKEFSEQLKVVGGQLANSSHKEILEDYPESLVIFDNGEVPFKQIADIAVGKKQIEDIGKIPNLAFNMDKKPVLTEYKDFNWIAEAHSKPSNANIKEVLEKDGVVAIRLSQGCWGNCTFCTHPGEWHGAKIDKIIDVLKEWKEQFGLKGIFFTDDEIVNKDPKEAYKRLEMLSDKLIKADLGITWTTALRADCVNWFDEKLINKMKQAGCVSMFLGIESGSDTQLLRYGKPVAQVPVTAEINEKAIKLFSENGMKVGIGWIPFDPLMPTLRELKENIDFIERNNLIDQNIKLDTSLRAQRGSAYTKTLGNMNMGLLGELQPNMFHYDAAYLDPRVGTIKDHIKEWYKDMEELDADINGAKFQLAVDPSLINKYKPLIEVGKKIQLLTIDYLKALINAFDETKDDKILDGVISKNPDIKNEARAKLRDKTFMFNRNKDLKQLVIQKREDLADITQAYNEERINIIQKYYKLANAQSEKELSYCS